jgi:hypothetical protein
MMILFYEQFDDQEEYAHFIFEKLAQFLKVDSSRINLLFFDEDDPNLETWIVEYVETGSRPVGFYVQNEEGYFILVEYKQLQAPAALIGTLAHELCHYVLIGEKGLLMEGEENEWLTDLLAISYGFGIFIGNLRFGYSSALSTWDRSSYWVFHMQGYLPQQITAYALAKIEMDRNDFWPEWMDFLQGDFKIDFQRSMQFCAALKNVKLVKPR